MKRITLQDIFDYGWQAFVVECKPLCMKPRIPGYERECTYMDGKGNYCTVGGAVAQHYPNDILLEFEKAGAFDKVVKKFPDYFDVGAVDSDDTILELNLVQSLLHDTLPEVGDGGRGESEIQKARREIYLAFAERFCLSIPA